MKLKSITLMLLMAGLLVSCFEEDKPVPPYVPPENVESVSIQNSIYTSQIYFDFSSGIIVSENNNSEWVLGFECQESGFHIRTNSSDLWGIAHTGSTDISLDLSETEADEWISDKADGNPDSTAVGAWVSFTGDGAEYTHEVMLLGQYDGIAYRAAKKVQFIRVDELFYTFLICDLEESAPDTVDVFKDDAFNYVYYSMADKELKILEPPKMQWDILFTQYFTVLFTDDGIPAPYYVRGVWINPYNIETALDTTTHFFDVNALNALENNFSSLQDAIGHDWKSVEVNEATNSAEYKVRPGYTYIIRDTEGDLYKLRFKSYFNSSGEKGFPSFEYAKLETPSS